jgi:hypothetical protein
VVAALAADLVEGYRQVAHLACGDAEDVSNLIGGQELF